MYATLAADGKFSVFEGVPTLKQLQEAVRGSSQPQGTALVEVLYMHRLGIDGWINEEGKYMGENGASLPHNELATWMMQDIGPGLFAGDFVAGDVVFTSHDDDGNTTTLTDDQLDALKGWLRGKAVIAGDFSGMVKPTIRVEEVQPNG